MASSRQWLHARNDAALKVQSWYRAIRGRQWYNKFCRGLVMFQSIARGYLLRRKTLPELRKRLPTQPPIEKSEVY